MRDQGADYVECEDSAEGEVVRIAGCDLFGGFGGELDGGGIRFFTEDGGVAV